MICGLAFLSNLLPFFIQAPYFGFVYLFEELTLIEAQSPISPVVALAYSVVIKMLLKIRQIIYTPFDGIFS